VIEEEVARAIREIEAKIHFEDNTENNRQLQRTSSVKGIARSTDNLNLNLPKSDGSGDANPSPRRERKLEKQTSGRDGKDKEKDREGQAEVLNRRSSSKKQGRRLKKEAREDRRDTKEDKGGETEEAKERNGEQQQNGADSVAKVVDARASDATENAAADSKPEVTEIAQARTKLPMQRTNSAETAQTNAEQQDSQSVTNKQQQQDANAERHGDGEIMTRPLRESGLGRSLKREFSGVALRRENSSSNIGRYSGGAREGGVEEAENGVGCHASPSDQARPRLLKREFSGKDLPNVPNGTLVLRREGSTGSKVYIEKEKLLQEAASQGQASPLLSSPAPREDEKAKVGSGLARLPLATMDRSPPGERLERVSARERRLVKDRLREEAKEQEATNGTCHEMLLPGSARRKEEEREESGVGEKRRKSSPRTDKQVKDEEGKERQHSPKPSALGEGDGEDGQISPLNRTSSRRRKGEKKEEKRKEDKEERKEEKEKKRRDKEKPSLSLDLQSISPDHRHAAQNSAPHSPHSPSPLDPLASPRSARSAGWIKISKSTGDALPPTTTATASNSRHLWSSERQRPVHEPTANYTQNSNLNQSRDSSSSASLSAGTSTNPSSVAWSSTSPRGSGERGGDRGAGGVQPGIPLIRLNSNRVLQLQQQAGESVARSPRKMTKDLGALLTTSIDIGMQ
jgi:hypothetical protein